MIVYSGRLAGSDGSVLIVSATLEPAPDVPPVEPPSSTGTILLGAGGQGVADGKLASALASGRVDCASTWADSFGGATAQDQLREEYREWRKPIDLAIGGMWPDQFIPGSKTERQSWRAAADGKLDGLWRQILESIKDAWRKDYGLLNIRFCHEFNGTWYKWFVRQSEVAYYKAAFARFVALQREILPGSNVVWGLNDDTTFGYDVMLAYPGDENVDIFGVDGYNQWPHVKTQAEMSTKMVSVKGDGSPRGFESWRRMAEAHGKPMCIPEWSNNGQSKNTAAQGGGGESPVFVTALYDWLIQHAGTGAGQVKYANLFNLYTQYQLHPVTIQPETARTYLGLF